MFGVVRFNIERTWVMGLVGQLVGGVGVGGNGGSLMGWLGLGGAMASGQGS